MNSIAKKSLAWLLALVPALAIAAPAGAQNGTPSIVEAADGTATVVMPDGNRYTISGGTLSGDGSNLFHSFREFGLKPHEIATFLSNPNIRNILSRVTGGNASVIRGLLEVSGGNSNLFLINPAGIIFGPEARLNVPGDFTAATATGIGFEDGGWFNASGANDYTNLGGDPNVFAFNAQSGAIVNAGELSVADGHGLLLLGSSVANTGTLSADDGRVTLAAVEGTNRVRVSLPGHLLSLEIEVQPDQIVTANHLPELLTGSGSDVATGLTAAGQTVAVDATGQLVPGGPGSAIASGTIEAAGVQVFGDTVAVVGADIDASGNWGGGVVLIGGDARGVGPLPTAERVFVDAESTIAADALVNGEGGKVVIWADGVAGFSGEISARGAGAGNAGGFVEVSGREELFVNGRIDASAPAGSDGTILLDPRNIFIVAEADAPDNGELSDNQILFADGGPTTDFTISDVALTSLMGNVVLEAQNNISAEAAAVLDLGQITGESISFSAGNDIILNTDISTQGGDVVLTATNNITTQNISTEGGDVVLTATNSNIATQNIATTSIAPGDSGVVDLTAGGAIATGTISTSSSGGNAGIVDLDAGTGITVVGGIDASASTAAAGNVFLLADDGDILTTDIQTTGAGGNGGDVTIFAVDGSILASNIATGSSNGIGGNIDLTAGGAAGSIDTTAGTLDTSTGSSAAAGEVSLLTNAGGEIRTGAIVTRSSGGLSGNVSLDVLAGSGAIDTRGGNIDTGSTGGTGGGVFLTTNGNINTLGIVTGGDIGSGTIVLTSTNGNVDTSFGTLNTTAGSNSAPIVLSAGGELFAGGIVTSGTGGGVTFTGSEIDFVGGTDSIIATGNVVAISPANATQDIDLRGRNVDSSLALTFTDLAAIAEGAAQITIGRVDGSGTLTAIDPLTFDDPVLLQMPAGSIAIDTDIAGVDDASITLQGLQTTLAGDIVTEGDSIVIESNILVDSSSILDTNELDGGDVLVTGTVDAVDGDEEFSIVSGLGTTTLQSSVGSTTPVASFGAAGNTVTLGGDVIANNDIALAGNEIDLLGTTINSSGVLLLSPALPEQPIALGGTDNTTPALDLTADELDVLGSDFAAIVIGNPVGSGTLSVLAPIDFSAPLTLQSPNGSLAIGGQITGFDDASVTLIGSGSTTTLNADIRTEGNAIAIDDNTIVAADVTLDTTLNDQPGAAILIAGDVSGLTGTEAFDVIAGIGDITVNGAIANLGAIDFNSSGTTTLFGAIASQSLNMSGGGTTLLGGGSIVTSGDQIYDDAILLTASLAVESGGDLRFNSSIDGTVPGAQHLSANSSGVTQFGAVGALVPLDFVVTDTPGTTQLNGNITVTGTLTFGDPVQIDSNIALAAGGDISFASSIDSQTGETNDLAIASSLGDITLGDNVGRLEPLGELALVSPGITRATGTIAADGLTTDPAGTTQLDGGSVTTTGNQTFGDPVTTAPDTILTGNAIAFNADVVAGGSLTLNATTAVAFPLGGTVTGTGGTLGIAPQTPESDIVLEALAPPALSVTGLSGVDGFEMLEIGRADGTGTIATGSSVVLNDSVLLQSPGGTIDILNDLTLGDGAAIALEGDTRLGAALTTSGTPILLSDLTLTGDALLNTLGSGASGADVIVTGTITGSGSENLAATTGTGNATFGGAIADVGLITVSSSGTTSFGDVTAAELVTDPGGITQLDGDVTVSGSQTYGDRVVIASTIELTAGNVIGFPDSLDVGDNGLILTSDGAIAFGSVDSVTGTGTLTLQTADPSRDVLIGGSDPNALSFPTFDALADGFASLEIGRSDSTGNLTVATPTTFTDPTTLRAADFTIAASLIGTDNASITLIGSFSTIDLNADIITNNTDIFLDDNVIVGTDATLSTGSGGGGNVTITGTVDAATPGGQSLTIAAGDGSVDVQAAIGSSAALTSFFASGSEIVLSRATVNNAIALIGDEIDLLGPVAGDTIALNNRTVGRGITLGMVGGNNGGDPNPETLDLTADDLAALTDGFTSISIGGGTTGSISVALGDTANFTDPTSLEGSSIAADGTIAGTGDASFAIAANQDLAVSTVTTQGGSIDLTNTASDSSGTTTASGSLQSQGGDISAVAENSTIDFSGAAIDTTSPSLPGGDVALEGGLEVRSGAIATGGGDVSIASNGSIDTTGGTIDTTPTPVSEIGFPDAGDIALTAETEIVTGNLDARGTIADSLPGNITIASSSGNIDTSSGTLDASADEGSGGTIALSAGGRTDTGAIVSRSRFNAGGTIVSTSATGFSASGEIDTSSDVGLSGGTISISTAEGDINTLRLNASGGEGSGGNVSLFSSSSDGNIVVGSIDASGGSGGGTVDIETPGFVRITDTLPNADPNADPVSISTSSSDGDGGAITIRHGGNGEIPFIVGDSELNGSEGVPTSGDFTIEPGSYLFTEVQGNVAIISVDDVDPDITDSGDPETPLLPANTEANPLRQEQRPVTQNLAFRSDLQDEILTIEDAREILQVIERATGIKSALLYVNFAPAAIAGETASRAPAISTQRTLTAALPTDPTSESTGTTPDDPTPSPELHAQVTDIADRKLAGDFQRIEAQFTNDFENFLSLPEEKASPTLTPPYRDDDRLEILLVTPDSPPKRLVVPDATRAEVLELAQTMYGFVSDPRFIGTDDYLEPSQQLYNWMLAPLAADLVANEIDNLLFIMPRGLRLLPVAALHDGEQFVAQRYSAGLAPSLSLNDNLYRDVKDLRVYAVGASEFPGEQEQVPLPAVSVEVPAIATRLWRGDSVLNEDFTIENFQAERRSNPTGIIHLATHADFRFDDPNDIYIQFYDERLRLDRIRDLSLNEPPVELMVLSACRTAVGNESYELGFAGLAVQAGVKTVVASLWYVGDTGTLGLMTEFYNQLNTAPIKAEALQLAQVALIEGAVSKVDGDVVGPSGTYALPEAAAAIEEDLSHPFYWASFTAIGSPW
ncbi:filamentous hemagglutinin family N-terminal domain protein [Rubidibacter lacunae KORDI 51-2]|uniref:Filamentous hemagglutinin family N-terminal domain protein n=1 Tax=Rubidibacter lacunae KORDI 51-2 TaxID=582515 RepID=U5DLG0_9CHRO|nr:CHAT domain-containing protein [Rubidibacter lacunae]ERN41712.1 filamentous hemagglutinin family N-terminal domain protein [Rubidibacter lacunae KORDI 51-2]